MRYSATADELHSAASINSANARPRTTATPRTFQDGKSRLLPPSPPAQICPCYVLILLRPQSRFCRNRAARPTRHRRIDLVCKRFFKKDVGPASRLTTPLCTGLPCRVPCCLRPSHARHARVG